MTRTLSAQGTFRNVSFPPNLGHPSAYIVIPDLIRDLPSFVHGVVPVMLKPRRSGITP